MMVYKGSDEALRVHVNGDVIIKKDPFRFIVTKKSSGDVLIGRKYVEVDAGYCSTMVDELMLWNRSLTTQEVENVLSLYQQRILRFFSAFFARQNLLHFRTKL